MPHFPPSSHSLFTPFLTHFCSPPSHTLFSLLSHTQLQVEEDDDFSQLVNPKTKYETAAVGDVNMTSLKQGDIIQLERKGYYIVDQAHSGADNKPVVLFNIPDGRVKSLGLVADQQQQQS